MSETKMRPLAQLRKLARTLNLKGIGKLQGYTKAEKDWLHSEVKRLAAGEIKAHNKKVLQPTVRTRKVQSK